jgi:hypothetical protein
MGVTEKKRLFNIFIKPAIIVVVAGVIVDGSTTFVSTYLWLNVSQDSINPSTTFIATQIFGLIPLGLYVYAGYIIGQQTEKGRWYYILLFGLISYLVITIMREAIQRSIMIVAPLAAWHVLPLFITPSTSPISGVIHELVFMFGPLILGGMIGVNRKKKLTS